jgi:hypothetical protein
MFARKKMIKNVAITAAALAASILVPDHLQAAAIPLGGGGVLQLNNMTGQLVGVDNTCINWGTPAACQTTTGIQDTVSGQDPAVFTVGSTSLDTIKDLPAGVSTPLVDFMTAASPLPGGEVFFNLESIIIPAMPVGNNCTTFALSAICNPGGGSPFILVQSSANQVSITLSTNEIAYTGSSTSGSTPYNSIFTTQLSGDLPTVAGNPYSGDVDTIPNILDFVGAGGTITATWSATQSPTVPEPMSFVLLGSGLVGMGLWTRRSRRF